ncbi:MAG: polymer-forming cytoskeletal protein [Candidatus Heimdallarchaeota archaeon]|nr:polymer-forming cytoskeletal protein [Candidatus Heimdallarchaeota archaeon]
MSKNDTLEGSLLTKLENKEITQEEYDELIEKFGSLDLLSSRIEDKPRHSTKNKRWNFSGSSRVDGDDVEVPVRVSGKLVVDGDLKCPTFKVSGSSTINGNLTVIDTVKASGSLSVHGDVKLGGPVKISGKLQVTENLYVTSTLKVSGKSQIGKDVVLGDYAKISGHLIAAAVKSNNILQISGKVTTEGDLVADEFHSSGGSSRIGGNLLARVVNIAQRWRTGEFNTDSKFDDHEFDSLDSLPDLGRFISNLVNKVVPSIINMAMPGRGNPPSIFEVAGNIEGTDVDISYTHVSGDVVADKVVIGPNVTITGKIKYRSELIIPENTEYRTEQVE